MTINYFYSASTRGFFRDDIHASIPDDAVTVTEQYHAELLNGQKTGLEITPDDNGYPVLTAPIPITIEQRREHMKISAAQARLNLAALGILQDVLDHMNTLPDTATIKILWEYSVEYSRNDARLVDFLQDKFAMTSEEIDALFIVQ